MRQQVSASRNNEHVSDRWPSAECISHLSVKFRKTSKPPIGGRSFTAENVRQIGARPESFKVLGSDIPGDDINPDKVNASFKRGVGAASTDTQDGALGEAGTFYRESMAGCSIACNPVYLT
jgi:hypothetical protein